MIVTVKHMGESLSNQISLSIFEPLQDQINIFKYLQPRFYELWPNDGAYVFPPKVQNDHFPLPSAAIPSWRSQFPWKKKHFSHRH